MYDENLMKRFIIDHGKLQFDKISGWNLFGICDKPDGSLSGHDTFCIHDDPFYIIQSTNQDKISCWSLYKTKQMKTNICVK